MVTIHRQISALGNKGSWAMPTKVPGFNYVASHSFDVLYSSNDSVDFPPQRCIYRSLSSHWQAPRRQEERLLGPSTVQDDPPFSKQAQRSHPEISWLEDAYLDYIRTYNVHHPNANPRRKPVVWSAIRHTVQEFPSSHSREYDYDTKIYLVPNELRHWGYVLWDDQRIVGGTFSNVTEVLKELLNRGLYEWHKSRERYRRLSYFTRRSFDWEGR